MPYEWDEAKRRGNIAKHGIDFESVHRFDWTTARYEHSVRQGEERVFALGYIGDRLHAVAYVNRGETPASSACGRRIGRRRIAMPPLKPGHISSTPEEDAEIEAAIASDPDTREITGELRPAMEDPFIRQLVKRIEAERKAREAIAKTRVTLRLDADVVSRLREDGPGWQARANWELRRAVLGA